MDTADTRTRLLRVVWDDIRRLTTENVGSYPAAARAISAGAAADDVVRAMTAAAYEMAFGLLFLLSAEHAEIGEYERPLGWALVEVDLSDDDSVRPTGSGALDMIHENLLTADPTGSEGQDLFA